MKIALRKVTSGKVNAEQLKDAFTPLKLERSTSIVSITCSSQGFEVSLRYGVEWHKIQKAWGEIRRDRQVRKVWSNIDLLVVPSTYASNSKNISKFSEQLCEFLTETNYLHFTHFGYLKNAFPKSQIKQILGVFLKKEDIFCEVCWDIDEKYFEDMRELLENELKLANQDVQIDCFEQTLFAWNAEYDRLRNLNKRLKTELSERRNEEIMREIERRQNMATDNNITAPNINTVDVGNAGEFYAMSLFIRMGFITAKAPEGTADYDLMVMSNDGYSFKPIQVKTITDGEHWLLRQRHELVNEGAVKDFV